MTRDTVAADDMDYLRRESLQTVLACTAVGVYLWCMVLFVRRIRFGPPWWGPILVAIGLIVASSVRNRTPSLAGASLALGLAAASLHGMMLTGMEIAPYMLVVVVSLGGLFFGLRTRERRNSDNACIAGPAVNRRSGEIAVIDRMVEAAVHGDRGAALQALLLDPVVNGISQAEAILDEMLEVHRDYLPQFSE